MLTLMLLPGCRALPLDFGQARRAGNACTRRSILQPRAADACSSWRLWACVARLCAETCWTWLVVRARSPHLLAASWFLRLRICLLAGLSLRSFVRHCSRIEQCRATAASRALCQRHPNARVFLCRGNLRSRARVDPRSAEPTIQAVEPCLI